MIIATVGQILGDRPLHAVAPGDTVRGAALILREHGVGAVAVIEEARLVGVLTERDIVWRCVAPGRDADQVSVGEIMTRDPVTVDAAESVSDALALKLGDVFRHLPVMSGGRPVGMLSYRDIPAEYLALFERFREMAASRPGGTP